MDFLPNFLFVSASKVSLWLFRIWEPSPKLCPNFFHLWYHCFFAIPSIPCHSEIKLSLPLCWFPGPRSSYTTHHLPQPGSYWSTATHIPVLPQTSQNAPMINCSIFHIAAALFLFPVPRGDWIEGQELSFAFLGIWFLSDHPEVFHTNQAPATEL